MTSVPNSPRVSVIMPVFNAGKYLAESIGSILNQSFTDFELIIINDGSTDSSMNIVRSFRDQRIRIMDRTENRRIVYTLNEGLAAARGEYIARMDSDDISFPRRLEKQVRFLDKHSDVVACGTQAIIFSPHHRKKWKVPLDHKTIRAWMLFYTVIVHPAAMLRRKVLLDHALSYTPGFEGGEDYDLFLRMSSYGKLANLPDKLLWYRKHEQQVTTRQVNSQEEIGCRVREFSVRQLIPEATADEIALHHDIAVYVRPMDRKRLQNSEQWLLKLLDINRSKGLFQQRAMESVFSQKWLACCYQHAHLGTRVLVDCLRSPLTKLKLADAKLIAKFMIKSLRASSSS